MVSTERKLTKNEKRRLRKKELLQGDNKNGHQNGTMDDDLSAGKDDDMDGIEVQYVSAEYSEEAMGAGFGSVFDQFKQIFDKFAKPEELLAAKEDDKTATLREKEASNATKNSTLNDKAEKENSLSSTTVDGEGEPKKLSKKKKKLMSRLSVAELKQLVPRPDVVEAHDVTSHDPRLLVYIKAYRNTVGIPRHWCHKRKYLQGKRGIEKPPFQLPEFIADTGIAKIRESVLEQESLKKSKQKARDKLTPKMGKIDIDYQVLHDAFFKYQKKPKLTSHGDIYYEGKEFEVDLKEKKPGILSSELIAALGMGDLGAQGVVSPPPWLINMQRYGPPPSYPNLRIPGLNAPIPQGAVFGYQPGGWGKPPVDEYGRPIYGDVFGIVDDSAGYGIGYEATEADKVKWGRLSVAEAEESSSSEEDEDEERDEEDEDEEGDRSAISSGLDTPHTLDGISSLVSGMETPDIVDLRKRAGMETPDLAPRELYTVIQERQGNAAAAGQLFGSDKTYVLPSTARGGVQMSINPDQLENQLQELGDQEALKDAYDAQLSANSGPSSGLSRNDVDDLDDEGRGKRRKRGETSGSVAKRYKDFKF